MPSSAPPEFCCPLSKKIKKDPVVVGSGQTYDKDSILDYLKHSKKRPLSKLEINEKLLFPNLFIRESITICSLRNNRPLKGSGNVVLTGQEIKNPERLLESAATNTSPIDRRGAT